MKQGIHPEYVETQVTCTCGNTFTTYSTAKNGALSLGGDNRLTVHKGDIAVNSSHAMALSLFNSELEVLAGELALLAGFGTAVLFAASRKFRKKLE